MKDNNNLLSYNQWTTGEYNNNTIGFQNKAILSNIWSDIGEYSLKLNRKNNTYSEYVLDCNLNLQSNNYLCKVKILSTNTSGQLGLYSSNGLVSSVNYSPNSKPQLLSLTASSEIKLIRIVNWTLDTSVFIDEFSIEVV